MNEYISPTSGKTMSGSGSLLLYFLSSVCPLCLSSPLPPASESLREKGLSCWRVWNQPSQCPWELRTTGEVMGFFFHAPLPSKDFNYPQLCWPSSQVWAENFQNPSVAHHQELAFVNQTHTALLINQMWVYNLKREPLVEWLTSHQASGVHLAPIWVSWCFYSPYATFPAGSGRQSLLDKYLPSGI